jgi:signal transduction histidine kinase/DNA-binding response OmpR family regulator
MSDGLDANVRILVVEDDPHVRQMLGLLLGARWRVEMADGGEAARDMALASPPDLVISDVRMPGIDGIELLRALRAAPATHDVPVILVSARAGERETIAGLEAGADDFLIKPFSGRELMVRVQARLDMIDMRRRTTRQDEALAALQRHSEWTEKLLDSLPVPLWLLEPASHRVLFSNHAARRMTVDPSAHGDGLCERLALALPDDEGGGALDVRDLMPASEGDRIRGRRVVSMTSEGSVYLLADAARLPALHEHPAVAVLSLRDVTELQRKEDLLRSALHVRDEFLSVASHELRTPITTLSLQTESAFRGMTAAHADGTGTEERILRKLTTIRRQIVRLEQLVEALLDVSRLMEGRLHLSPEEVDLGVLATDIVESLSDAAAHAGSTINLHCASGVVGRWDRLRIGQVITNLISNAIKFGRGHPIDVDVDVDAETNGQRAARVRVQDAGIGIPPEQRKRIFDRFERAPAERHYPGLGLGLWIAKQIVDASSGTITVDSEVGVGSTFTVRLPRSA